MAQRVALACATVCATILQPVDDCVLVRGRQVKKQFGPSRQEFKNIPSNATKHYIVCNSNSFRRARARPYQAARACVGGKTEKARLCMGGPEIPKHAPLEWPRALGWKPPARRRRALLGDGGGDNEASELIILSRVESVMCGSTLEILCRAFKL